jgi:hypothetical protein
MTIPLEVGAGIGQVYVPTYPSTGVTVLDHHGLPIMEERTVIRRVGEKKITVLIRNRIRPEHPYLNLVRATAYTYQFVGSPFPVPPLRREARLSFVKRRQTI